MENNQLNSPNFFDKGQGKDKYFSTQMQRVFAALYRQPKTMLMVSIETGIYRANLCRYIGQMKKHDRICIVRKGICPISKHRAGYYTTNPSIIEHSNTAK